MTTSSLTNETGPAARKGGQTDPDAGNWYRLTADETLKRLQSSAVEGLSDAEARKRHEEHGSNELIESGGRGPWRILAEQFHSTLIWMLIIAAGVSIYLHEPVDAVVIILIVLINAGLGFYQDFRAERAMAALKQLAVPNVKVRRDGQLKEIPARELVPGDIAIVEAGNLVPADCRVISVHNLQTDESALTGESTVVDKTTEPVTDEHAAIGDRQDMMFMGTIVSFGRGEGVVTDIGMKTELGRIAHLMQSVEHKATPLQKRLSQLGRQLAIAAVVIVAIVFAMGVYQRVEPRLMFMTAISLAVAAVPEGLPAVATLALAIGARRMLKRKALIRKLPAVESLGSVTVICSDKTGTLTQNRMTVTQLEVAGKDFAIQRSVEDQWSDERKAEFHSAAAENPALVLLVSGGCLCNDAVLSKKEENDDEHQAVGEPTEAALVVAASRMGLKKGDLEAALPRSEEFAFDSDRKRMTTIHDFNYSLLQSAGEMGAVLAKTASQQNWKRIAFTKGAADSILNVSNSVWAHNQSQPLNDEWKERISSAQDKLADKGMRVLALAIRAIDTSTMPKKTEEAEQDLTFVGLFGIIDPPRPEARDAVARCTSAGIRTVMITGDHPLTARHIARDLGISKNGDALTGSELSRMSQEELESRVEETHVYARVSPEHKLKIVKGLQTRGQIVSMTGDGVNDAPALKTADIGVAMGVTGTDVAKEAAEMVLLDDNFATIVNAVEEGRVIYDNIRKFIRYLLTSNSGEIWVMLVAPLIGLPLALLPLQILWINLVTDGLPALALGVERAERNIMQRPPRSPKESLIGRGMGIHVIWVGMLMAAISLATGYFYYQPGDTENRLWQTMLFNVLTLAQMAHAMAIRSERDSLFTIGIFSNRRLVQGVGITLLLQIAVTYVPFLQSIFKTVPLPPFEFILCGVLGSLIFWAVEIEKWFSRRARTAET